jgi:hypothetical protein
VRLYQWTIRFPDERGPGSWCFEGTNKEALARRERQTRNNTYLVGPLVVVDLPEPAEKSRKAVTNRPIRPQRRVR